MSQMTQMGVLESQLSSTLNFAVCSLHFAVPLAVFIGVHRRFEFAAGFGALM
jgi:hypothetical protein